MWGNILKFSSHPRPALLAAPANFWPPGPRGRNSGPRGARQDKLHLKTLSTRSNHAASENLTNKTPCRVQIPRTRYNSPSSSRSFFIVDMILQGQSKNTNVYLCPASGVCCGCPDYFPPAESNSLICWVLGATSWAFVQLFSPEEEWQLDVWGIR